jgi:VWFA-related protein
MPIRVPVVSSLLILLAVTSPEGAQESKRFKARSELVALHVSVFGNDAEMVTGLPREAFTIYDDGEVQTLRFFENRDNPVTVGLVIDSSISMSRKRAAVIAAGRSFAESSHADDEMFTINFNERVWPGLPDGQAFTSDRAELTRALNRSGAIGRTALFDALDVALRQLDGGQCQKKVLIVVSDGGDNASRATFDRVLDTAMGMDAIIYTVRVDDEYDGEGDPEVLRKLAGATGGEAFFPRRPDRATGVLKRIAKEIRSGYTLGYVPTSLREGYHPVRVEVKTPDGRKLRVRARAGYVSRP